MTTARLFPLAGALPCHPEVERWFAGPPGALRRAARQWFANIRALGPDVQELLHDGHPTACVAGIALAYVNVFAAHLNIGFFLGSTLPDPAGLLRGTGRFMRHVRVAPEAPLDRAAVRALLKAAYADLKFRLAAPVAAGSAPLPG